MAETLPSYKIRHLISGIFKIKNLELNTFNNIPSLDDLQKSP